MPDLYSVLGLSRRATSEEIKLAYWALVKLSHPDVNGGRDDAERRTKEINRAYETLGHPEARTAYDLELRRRRARARRSFWSAAAMGAATLVVTVGIVFGTVKWSQHVHPTAGGEEVSVARSSEKTVAKAPSRGDRAGLPSAEPAHSDMRNAQRMAEGARAAPLGEPPSSANPEVATFRDPSWRISAEPPARSLAVGHPTPAEQPTSAGSPQQVGAPQLPNPEASHAAALQSTAMREVAPKEKAPTAPAALEALAAQQERPSAASDGPSGTMRLPDEDPRASWLPVPSLAMLDPAPNQEDPKSPLSTPQPPKREPIPPSPAVEPQAGKHERASPPELGAKLPGPRAATRTHNKSKKQFEVAETRSTPASSKVRRSDREPGLVSSRAMAMRFPSADEPYVNLGTRR